MVFFVQRFTGHFIYSHGIVAIGIHQQKCKTSRGNKQLTKFTSQEFSQNLYKAGGQIGFDIGKPQLLELRDDKSRSFVDSIKKNLTPDIQFVTIILPTPQADRYDSIKQICCLELPVPSQCILAK